MLHGVNAFHVYSYSVLKFVPSVNAHLNPTCLSYISIPYFSIVQTANSLFVSFCDEDNMEVPAYGGREASPLWLRSDVIFTVNMA